MQWKPGRVSFIVQHSPKIHTNIMHNYVEIASYFQHIIQTYVAAIAWQFNGHADTVTDTHKP